MDAVGFVTLAAVGLFAGCLNTVAGGGSLAAVPALMLLGLPADVANASNRVAVASQSIAAVVGFARLGSIERRAIAPVVATAAAGALGGALLATAVPVELLEVVLCGAMVGMAGLLVLRPRAVVAEPGTEPSWSRPSSLVALVAVGLYGGLVQAGVGFLLVGVLSGMVGYGVGPASALKSLATLVFSAVSLAVFVAHGLVAWVPALTLAVFTAIGSAIGVKLAMKTAPRALRWLLFLGVVATSIAAIAR